MQNLITVIILLSFFSCNPYQEGIEHKIKPSFETKDNYIQLNCGTLFQIKEKISKIKFFKNGVFLRQITGFEIQKAKLCPKISFDEKRDRITAIVMIGNKKIDCHIKNKTINCEK